MTGTSVARQAACSRCGKRSELFWHGRRELCVRCIERVKHPIETSPVTVANVLGGAARLMGAVGLQAALVTALFQLPLVALILWTDAGAILSMIWAMVSLVGTGAVIDLALQHVAGEESVRIGRAIGVGARAWVGLFFVALVSSLVIGVGFLLLVVPGIFFALSYALIFPLIVDGDAKSTDAMGLSRQRMKGHRWTALFVFALVYLPPILWLVLMGPAGAAGGLDPRAVIPPELRPMSAAYVLVDALLALPIAFVSVVLHLKLRRPLASTAE